MAHKGDLGNILVTRINSQLVFEIDGCGTDREGDNLFRENKIYQRQNTSLSKGVTLFT